MQSIQFEDFTIRVKDFTTLEIDEEEVFFITDSEIDADEFDAFAKYRWNHSKTNEYFEVVFNDQPFHGRFGQLIFSKNDLTYKLRLTFVKSIADKMELPKGLNFVTDDHEYSNLYRKVIEQEVVIERLLDILKDKEVLSDEQVNSIVKITSHDTWKNQVALSSEVENLEEYLAKTEDTLSEMKSK